MAKYVVVFERSAVQVHRITVEAHNEENAALIAHAEHKRQGGRADRRIISHTSEFVGDDESVWDLADVEEQNA